MGDTTLAAFIGASAAIIGIIIGQVVILLNGILQRKWQRDDLIRERKKEIIEKRLLLVEESLKTTIESYKKMDVKANEFIDYFGINNKYNNKVKMEFCIKSIIDLVAIIESSDLKRYSSEPAIYCMNNESLSKSYLNLLHCENELTHFVRIMIS